MLWKRFLSHIRQKKEAGENNHKNKVFVVDINNAGDRFNNDLLDFFRVDMEPVEIAAHADLLMLGGVISSLQNPERPFNPAPLHVWGSGFLFGDDNDFPLCRPNLVVHALRGKLSKEKLSSLLGYPLPENLPLADPGLLASYFATPNVEKKYSIGFIPHFREHETDEVKRVLSANANMHFIDITRSPKEVIKEIQRCEAVVSSSLHGLVFSDSLGIPDAHVRLTELPKGGSFKFRDYYSSFDLVHSPLTIEDVCVVRPEEIQESYIIESRVVEVQSNWKEFFAIHPNVDNIYLNGYRFFLNDMKGFLDEMEQQGCPVEEISAFREAVNAGWKDVPWLVLFKEKGRRLKRKIRQICLQGSLSKKMNRK